MTTKTLIAALLAFVPSIAFAGAYGGAKASVTQVSANSSDTYNVVFNAGEVASVAISGDHDTDLDLYVYDENGNLVASDLSTTDDASVTWTPAWTGTFRIEVQNRGSVYNEYAIVTN